MPRAAKKLHLPGFPAVAPAGALGTADRTGRGGGRRSWPVDRSCRSRGGRGVCLTPRAEMPRGRLWRFGGRLGMEGNTIGNHGATSPLSVLACPLAGPCEAAVVAPQGKAGLFHKTAKFGDFMFTGLGVAWGRRKGWQQRPVEEMGRGCLWSCSWVLLTQWLCVAGHAPEQS